MKVKLHVTGLCESHPPVTLHKGSITRKMFPLDDVIMESSDGHCGPTSRLRLSFNLATVGEQNLKTQQLVFSKT